MLLLDYVAYVFLTCSVIFLVPGPIFFLSLTEGLHDFRRGLVMLLGVLTAQMILLLLLSSGFALLLTQIMPALRLVGAAFLLWLSFSAVRVALGDYSSQPKLREEGLKGSPFVRGFLMTFLNPAFILWLLTVGAATLETGLSAAGSSTYIIFGAGVVTTSAGVSFALILFSSHGLTLAGKHGIRLLSMISGLAFVVLAATMIISIFP